MFLLISLSMSLTWMINNRGPRIEPWGTPLEAVLQADLTSLVLTFSFLSINQVIIWLRITLLQHLSLDHLHQSFVWIFIKSFTKIVINSINNFYRCPLLRILLRKKKSVYERLLSEAKTGILLSNCFSRWLRPGFPVISRSFLSTEVVIGSNVFNREVKHRAFIHREAQFIV